MRRHAIARVLHLGAKHTIAVKLDRTTYLGVTTVSLHPLARPAGQVRGCTMVTIPLDRSDVAKMPERCIVSFSCCTMAAGRSAPIMMSDRSEIEARALGGTEESLKARKGLAPALLILLCCDWLDGAHMA